MSPRLTQSIVGGMFAGIFGGFGVADLILGDKLSGLVWVTLAFIAFGLGAL